jgi:endoglycosylceramidase
MLFGTFFQNFLLNFFLNTQDLVTDVDVSAHNSLSKISIRGSNFVDDYGRVKSFHGLNAVSKQFPWIPLVNPNLKNETELDNLKKWGFNVVRLGLMWSGLRPTKEFINTTYLDEMVTIINDLAVRGIYVIVELHQDMMSSKFGAYDGCPRWIVDSMPKSKTRYPWPFVRKDLVFAAYVTESCGFAFQNLYSNRNGFQDHFAEYWEIVANKLKNHTSVLAYEIINEPWAGDIYSDPFLLLPGKAGEKNLLPLYDNIYNVIRKFDQQTIVFYEPVTWGIEMNNKVLGTGFHRAPGNASQSTALSWHYYCWLYDIGSNKNGFRDFKRELCSSGQRVRSFESISNYKREIGTASFLTEFGTCIVNNENGIQDYQECENVLEYTDKYMESWTYWNANFYRDIDGQPNMGLLNTMSRVYPMSTSGMPISMSYDTITKFFFYNYWHDLKIEQPTEVFIPDHAYESNLFQVSASAHLKWSFDMNNRLLLITATRDVMSKRFVASEIQISPK